MSHRVTWFDVPVTDLDRATGFYSKVLAIRIDRYGPDVPVAVMEHGPGDVAGCLFLDVEHGPSMGGPLIYFEVEGRLEEATALAAELGGEILEAVTSIAPHGFRSVIRDSEGNRVALHSETA